MIITLWREFCTSFTYDDLIFNEKMVLEAIDARCREYGIVEREEIGRELLEILKEEAMMEMVAGD